MRLFGYELSLTKAAPLTTAAPPTVPIPRSYGGGWSPYVREPFAGAWQRNADLYAPGVIAHPTVFACTTLIASDIAKLGVDLLRESGDLAVPVDTSPFAAVLRRPNHYQNRIKFVEGWILSKLIYGNAYAYKERDGRGIVTALYLLDARRVRVLQSPNGDVYYALPEDPLAGLPFATTVPASEIIHDVMIPLFHPLCGVGPIFAAWFTAFHSQTLQENAQTLAENGSNPGGIITAPGPMSPENQERNEKYWRENHAGMRNVGSVAFLDNGQKYEAFGTNAVDAEMIKQLEWDDARIAGAFHVPGYKVGIGPQPSYNNAESMNLQYYEDGLQYLIEALELCLTEGLELPSTYEVELNLEGLLRMDTPTKMKTTTDGVKGGVYTPNEARQAWNKAPVAGGDTIYLQEQDHSIAWLARRDANPPAPPSPSPPTPAPLEPKALDRAAVITATVDRLEAVYAAVA